MCKSNLHPGAPVMAVRLAPGPPHTIWYRPVEVLEAAQTAHQGAIVSQVYEGNRVFGVAVVLDGHSRQDPESSARSWCATAQGLGAASRTGEVYPTTGRYAILHEGARRRSNGHLQHAGRDVASFVAEAKNRLRRRWFFRRRLSGFRAWLRRRGASIHLLAAPVISRAAVNRIRRGKNHLRRNCFLASATKDATSALAWLQCDRLTATRAFMQNGVRPVVG